ncbi:hypothetical protein GLW07_18920 [Bacillus hwajinpoensis]|uniref:Uncharacterized protein n=1 Tax=Guptibacillus hwajinpoensis TaxID=208199 RepID=A0A845F451_9BACL|nr:hypothetical protein [Pseudalkalibacillus hwajinpoensis]MYL65435.1 hypothetical protein [Pseudalkalibacillus hwajinpoensis]
MTSIYEQNQAFERAYEQRSIDPSEIEGMGRAHIYSNNKEKIKEFKIYIPYVIWFQELFFASHPLIDKLQEINNEMEQAKTSWLGFFRKTKKIETQFKRLYDLGIDLNNFKTDCKDFQQCILASQIHNNTDYADLIQEQERYLNLIESKIRQTGDRKLASINNSRMQFLGLVLSITAIAVSVYSIMSIN